MALLTAKGYSVQPFKCGPDYIDTKFHSAVCRRPSINLDAFMASPDHVRSLFAHYQSGADVSIVEGMMGLFDGYDRDSGSAAELSRLTDCPVVLVVDAASAAYSVAPLLRGFVTFRSDVTVCGVIFNRVGSDRHWQLLRQACADAGVECFGYVPRHASLAQGSRYLGLDFSVEAETETLVSLLDNHVDWQRLLQLTRRPRPTAAPLPPPHGCALIARNAESFSFLYQETLDRFADVRFFDPESEVPDFRDIDLLYLPGGYPEKHLEALAAAEPVRRAIADYAEQGGRIVAECGGMMYLCQAIVDDTGEYTMCGVLPHRISARQQDRHLSLGYRRFQLNGREYRGHEFHYTQFLAPLPPSATQVYDAKGMPVATPVLQQGNVLASYTHLYNIFAE